MFIDANIFLEILLKDRNYIKYEEFIKKLSESNVSFYTSDFIIYPCLLTISNKLASNSKFENFLVFIKSINIILIRPSIRAMYDALPLMKKYKLDFDDALVISSMHENGIKDLVSYDNHFKKVKEINIICP